MATARGPAFSARIMSGTLPAALAANAPLVSIVNGATKRLYIVKIQLRLDAVVAFTAASPIHFVGERYTGTALAGGSAATIFKHHSGIASAATEARISLTAALTGSPTYEGNQMVLNAGIGPAAGGTLGTVTHDLSNDPIKVQPNERFAIRNGNAAWPAAGTAVLSGVVTWYER